MRCDIRKIVTIKRKRPCNLSQIMECFMKYRKAFVNSRKKIIFEKNIQQDNNEKKSIIKCLTDLIQ